MKATLIKLSTVVLCFCFVIITSCGDSADPCPNCELEPMSGQCLALFKKYYFDKEENKCKEFSWGGCGGVVPFETLEECKECDCTN